MHLHPSTCSCSQKSPRPRAAAALSLLSAGFLLAHSNLPLHLPTTCPFKLLTGLPCGACGLTHAFCALANAHFHDAFNFHPGVFPLAIFISAAFLLLLTELATDTPLLAPLWHRTRPFFVSAGITLFILGWLLNLLKIGLPHI